jgi:Zn-finger nucleic acid-binding protein
LNSREEISEISTVQAEATTVNAIPKCTGLFVTPNEGDLIMAAKKATKKAAKKTAKKAAPKKTAKKAAKKTAKKATKKAAK